MARDRADSSPAGQLVIRLNTMVTQLMSENRKLKREIERLSQRATAPQKSVKRTARPPRRPVKKTVARSKPARKPATPKGRKTKAPTRRRRR